MLSNPGLYIHFPWCVKKCPYCDFNSHPLRVENNFDEYLSALLQDFDSQQQEEPFHTVFLGGGTPSLFGPEHFHELLSHLPIDAEAEVTMEANPGTTEHANFKDYLHAGINRLSIGAQSFNDAHLSKLGRIHSAQEILTTVDEAQSAGFNNINIDLMWGLPGQSTGQCLNDLQTAISLSPAHISWYQLTLEPKTEFARRPPVLPLEDAMLDMEARGLELLAEQGYVRYEVSAFQKDGANCAHNLNYWRFGDYLGIGAGAHGKISTAEHIRRTQKPHQPRLFHTDPTVTESRLVEDQEIPFEFMLNALRLVDGLSFEEFTLKTGLGIDAISPVWGRQVELGLVQEDRLATTPLGYRYLDSVVAEFLAG